MSGKSLPQIRGEMPTLINTPELRFQVDEPRKFAIIDEVLDRLEAAGAEVNRTDGARATTPDVWWLLRAPHTQDVIVARAESPRQQRQIGRADVRTQCTKGQCVCRLSL